MSWDIVLFNSRQKIDSVEDIDETCLKPTNFCSVFEKHFKKINIHEGHREIVGEDFAIDYFTDEEPVSNKMISLYGENALFESISLAKTNGAQIYDTGMGGMIDLNNPAVNGYENFQSYLNQILGK